MTECRKTTKMKLKIRYAGGRPVGCDIKGKASGHGRILAAAALLLSVQHETGLSFGSLLEMVDQYSSESAAEEDEE